MGTMNDEAETRQLASFQGALALGYGCQQELAIQQLQALLQEVQDNENKGLIILYMALFLAQVGRTAEAREQLREVVNLWERTPEHQARIAAVDAMLDEAAGQAPRTLDKLNRILEEYRTLWDNEDVRDLYEEIQFNRGRLLATIGDWRLALPVLEESLACKRPKAAEFYANLGYCYFHAEKWDKAEEALKLALSQELCPDYSSLAHYYLGRIFYLRGTLAKAMKEFELALSDATVAGTSRKVIYDALAKSSRYLGLWEEASRYAHLAKSSN
jgi:tetratricopeptide (TPR) repeat protein